MNGIESFWALVMREYHGTFHHFKPKHLPRYAAELAACYNSRDLDTIAQTAFVFQDMIGQQLKYQDMIA